MRVDAINRGVLALALLPFTGVLHAQATAPVPQVRSTRLAVAGHPGEAAVAQVNGRSYVDVESLARITGGTLGFQGSRIVLTLPVAGADGPAPSAQATAAPAAQAPAQSPALSREFVTSGIQSVSGIREWRSALVYAVQHNQPVTEEQMSSYRRSTEAQVALTAAAARTDQDRSAAALLQNELANMRTLSGNYRAIQDSNTNIRTDALDTDPLNAKVLNCMQGLAGMQAGGQFQDVASCH